MSVICQQLINPITRSLKQEPKKKKKQDHWNRNPNNSHHESNKCNWTNDW